MTDEATELKRLEDALQSLDLSSKFVLSFHSCR